jgi:hypothetical protein
VVYLAFDWLANRLHLGITNPADEPATGD